ncbi:universal stress protein [Novipirellula artificiosorum]|uniref:Universal stress protein E n=1 Tax=Novipirellula artificiosorum TaxID=2528016 RepID=A0A5C6D9S6_9BACT|nr:universal stress protein [Novipirellula artificiosorum]TWU32457.1 Universal stress protein E [Novipirellula artificiosorum]
MKRFKSILVTTDTRLESHPIVDEAAEVALRNDASLKIVDVVPPLPWIARITMEDPGHIAQLMVHEKAEELEALAKPIRERGVQVETKVLSGTTSVEIIREVLRGQHDLVLRVAKAKSSRSTGFFGSTGIELLRKCPCAVWLVCSTTSAQFKHVLVCVDTCCDAEVNRKLDQKVFEISSDISRTHRADLSVVHAWSIDGEQFLRKRMSLAELVEIERKRRSDAKWRLDEFLAKCDASVEKSQVHLVKGEACDVIPMTATECNADLVVMGMVVRSGPAGWIMGNVTEQVLASLECSVLALKPDGFVSPITIKDKETASV